MASGGGAPKVQQTASQLAAHQINAKLFNYYQTNYQPLINKQIESVASPQNLEQEKAQVEGQINASVMNKIDPTKATVNPAQNARTLSTLGKVEGTAKTTGDLAVRGRNLGERQNLINIGRGEATEAQEGMETLAGSSLNRAIAENQADLEEEIAGTNAVGSLVGTAAALGNQALKKPRTLSSPETFFKDTSYEAPTFYEPQVWRA